MVALPLNRIMRVWRKTSTPDGGGGSTVAWVDQASEVWVRLSSASATEREAAAQSGVTISHVGYWLPGEPIVRGDRLVDALASVEVISTVMPSRPDFVRAECLEDPFDEPTN